MAMVISVMQQGQIQAIFGKFQCHRFYGRTTPLDDDNLQSKNELKLPLLNVCLKSAGINIRYNIIRYKFDIQDAWTVLNVLNNQLSLTLHLSVDISIVKSTTRDRQYQYVYFYQSYFSMVKLIVKLLCSLLLSRDCLSALKPL